MKAVIVGRNPRTITFKQTGEIVEGYDISYLIKDQVWEEGEACEQRFMSKKRLGDYIPKRGDEVLISIAVRYENGKRRESVEHCELLKPAAAR